MHISGLQARARAGTEEEVRNLRMEALHRPLIPFLTRLQIRLQHLESELLQLPLPNLQYLIVWGLPFWNCHRHLFATMWF